MGTNMCFVHLEGNLTQIVLNVVGLFKLQHLHLSVTKNLIK